MEKPIIKSVFKLASVTTLLFIATGCASLSVKPDYTESTTNIPFIFIKGGNYIMGNDENNDEQPAHEVTVPDLFVAMYETTFDNYDVYCSATNCEPPSDQKWGRKNRPVINVSWHNANDYAAWLSEQTGQTYRLPSEAEWEYFARAGTTTEYWPGDNLPKGRANCRNCGSKWDNKRTAPVGSFEPNPWGIHDTAGNVTEWVLDDFFKGYDNVPSDGTPLMKPNDQRKVQRGGAWDYEIEYLRSSARDYRRAHSATSDTGFRLVLVPDASTPVPTAK